MLAVSGGVYAASARLQIIGKGKVIVIGGIIRCAQRHAGAECGAGHPDGDAFGIEHHVAVAVGPRPRRIRASRWPIIW